MCDILTLFNDSSDDEIIKFHKKHTNITKINNKRLQKMSSGRFSRYVNRFDSISDKDAQRFKKIRRVIRNRESARRSRKRKLDKLDELTTECHYLKLQVKHLQNENKLLKNENKEFI